MSCQSKIMKKVSRIKKMSKNLNEKQKKKIIEEMNYFLRDEHLSEEKVLERLKGIEKEIKSIK